MAAGFGRDILGIFDKKSASLQSLETSNGKQQFFYFVFEQNNRQINGKNLF
jgi:hypothetical protein